MNAVDMRLSNNDFSPLAKKFILDLLFIHLTCNYLCFDSRFYMQIRGTAMGANVAPTYANIFVTDMEETSIYTSSHFKKVLVWWRYIDDIFLIWTGDIQELQDFHSYLNTTDAEVNFTLTCSQEELHFLDTKVSVCNGKLFTSLYKKNTDRNTLLKFDSCRERGYPQKLVDTHKQNVLSSD